MGSFDHRYYAEAERLKGLGYMTHLTVEELADKLQASYVNRFQEAKKAGSLPDKVETPEDNGEKVQVMDSKGYFG